MPVQLPRRVSVDTLDLDEAHAYLASTYVEHSVRVSGDRERFRFRHSITDGGSFFVSHYDYALNCQVDTDPFGYLLVGQMLGGHLQLADGRTQLQPAVGAAFLVDPHAPMSIAWEGFQAGLVRIDLDVVTRVAEEVTGRDAGTLRFGLAQCASPEHVRHWQGLVRYVTQDFCRNEVAYSSPLVHAQTMRLLAASVLEMFPNAATAAPPPAPGWADASAVRRAVAYVEEHAGEPVGLTEIAAAARTGTRTMQEAFRRHLDTTPTAYLRQVRLERAHRDLRTADPATGATVADIAARWGFAHHGRFAALYRSRYGRSPGAVLREGW